MSRLITAKQVESAAADGERSLPVAADDVVTPLARDRAAVLGVSLGDPTSAAAQRGSPAGSQGGVTAPVGQADVARLAAESRVRVVARRQLLRAGRGLGDLEEVVAAVIERVRSDGGCLCGGRACRRGGGG